jgi:CubicO group peptidase (beta-lactamase class C family)
MSTSTLLTSPIKTRQGFTIEGLAEFKAQLYALVNNSKLANIVTLIARYGEIVRYNAYGVMNVFITPSVLVKPDSIFYIASITKPITFAAMKMLWKDG